MLLLLGSFIDPPVLSLLQFGASHLFFVSWSTPIPSTFLNFYNIVIVPAQPNAINNITTNDVSVILRLNNQSLYNITVGATVCSNLVLSMIFTAGSSKFPFYYAVLYSSFIYRKMPFLDDPLCSNKLHYFH